VYYTSPITQVIAPGQGTVGTTALVDASVTTAKLASTTGSGAVVLATSPTLVTPVLGAASATSITVAGSSSLGTASASGNTAIFQAPGSLYLTLNTNGTLSGNRRNWAISPEYDAAGALSFTCGASEGASPSSTKMIIDSSGNVGIGTSSPSALLSVKNSGMSSTLLLGSNTSNSNYGSISFNGSNADGGRIGWTAGGSGNNNLYYDVPSSGEHIWRYGSGSTEAMRINTSGKLVMASNANGLLGQIQAGTTANSASTNSVITSTCNQNGPYPFGARGESTNQGLVGFFDGSNNTIGSITKSGSNVAYNTSSDYRLKENIAPMTGALAKVAQLKPVTYTWKADGLDGEGFIAHELAEVKPHAVFGEKDAVDEHGGIKPQGIDTSFLVATLTAAIQELAAKNDALTARIEALENR
jgi:hypothetical protein